MHYKDGTEVKAGDRVFGELDGRVTLGIVLETVPAESLLVSLLEVLPGAPGTTEPRARAVFTHGDPKAFKFIIRDEDLKRGDA
jgi:hypothetical protein